MRTFFTYLLVACAFSSLASGVSQKPVTETAEAIEENQKLAISLLDDAIEKQRALLLTHPKDSTNHWNVSVRLVETLQSKAILLESLGTRNPSLKTQHRATLITLIATVTPVVSVCEKHFYCARAYLVRGRAWRQIGKMQPARADLEAVVSRYSKEPGVEKAILQLAQLEMDEGAFVKAIGYLEALRSRTDLPVHAQVIERLSWAYAAKGDYLQALELTRYGFQWLEKHPANKPEETVTPATLALNSGIFYARGVESKAAGLSGLRAPGYFIALVPKAELGIALRVFPNLVSESPAVGELDGFRDGLMNLAQPEMAVWDAMKQILLKNAQLRRLEPLNQTLAHYLAHREKNRSHFGDLTPALRRVEKNLLSYLGAEKVVLSHQDRALALKALRQIYTLGTDTPAQDLNNAKFRFNLAALELAEKNYQQARAGFRKVASMTSSTKPETQELSKNASLEAVKAGFRLVLDLLAAKPSDQGHLERAVAEWDDSVAFSERRYGQSSAQVEMNYQLSRGLMTEGHTDLALPRLQSLFKTAGNAAGVRDGALSLLLGHFVSVKDWDRLYSLTAGIDASVAHNPALLTSVRDVRERSILERVKREGQSKNHQKALEMVEKDKKYVLAPKSLAFLFETAANAAQDLEDQELTVRYLRAAQQNAPSTQLSYRLAVLQGMIAEAKIQLTSAQATYLSFFESVGNAQFDPQWSALQGRLEFLAILDANPTFLIRLSSNRAFCGNGFQANCRRLASFAHFLAGSTNPRRPANYLDQAGKSVRQTLSLKDLARIRASFEKEGGSYAGETASSSYIAYAVFGRLVAPTRQALDQERITLRTRFRLTKKPQTLSGRLTRLKSFEKSCTELLGSPLREFNQVVREGLAQAYLDMEQDLTTLTQLLQKEAPGDTESIATLSEMSARFQTLAQENRSSEPVVSLDTLAAIAGSPVRAPLNEAVSARKWGAARYLTDLGEKSDWLTAEQATGVRKLIAQGLIQKEGEIR